mgnify:CR=1 FL=1
MEKDNHLYNKILGKINTSSYMKKDVIKVFHC